MPPSAALPVSPVPSPPPVSGCAECGGRRALSPAEARGAGPVATSAPARRGPWRASCGAGDPLELVEVPVLTPLPRTGGAVARPCALDRPPRAAQVQQCA